MTDRVTVARRLRPRFIREVAIVKIRLLAGGAGKSREPASRQKCVTGSVNTDG